MLHSSLLRYAQEHMSTDVLLKMFMTMETSQGVMKARYARFLVGFSRRMLIILRGDFIADSA